MSILTDPQLQALSRNPEYRQFGGKCPVCRDTNKYRYLGEEYDCPDDDFGHPMLRLAKLYWLHNIGLQYQTQNWDDYPHQSVREDIEEYIEKYEFLRLVGAGITFYSKTLGVGKTWGATHVLKSLVKQGVDGWFVPFWEIMGYKDIEDWDEKNFKIKKLQEAELVVIDDIKKPYTARMGEYHADKLEEFIRPRTDSNLPTIITTNMSMEELDATFPRVFSLLTAKNDFIELSGYDARKSGEIYRRHIELALNCESRPVV